MCVAVAVVIISLIIGFLILYKQPDTYEFDKGLTDAILESEKHNKRKER